MSYQRKNRSLDESREMEAKAGIIKNADGSAMFRMGKTIAYAAVYGPRDLYPKFLQNPRQGILRCHYNMMPFSGSGERIRPGGNRRSKEISMVTEKALLPVLDLQDFPNAVVDIFIEFPQTDAGSRCAGICAAAIALADAGLSMKDLVAAISVGNIGGTAVVDLDKEEEDYPGEVADIPIAVQQRNDKISLLQMDGLITKDILEKAIQMGIKTCKKIHAVQEKALKEKYAKNSVQERENDE